MRTKEQVDEILRANSGWTEQDREFLMEIDEDTFAKIHANAAKPPPAAAKKDEELTDEEIAQLEAKLAKAKGGKGGAKCNTAEEYVQQAPAEIREVLEAGLKANKEQRDAVIKALKETGRCTFTDEQLAAKNLNELKALAALAKVPSFAGAVAAPSEKTGDKAPDMPTINWAEKK